MKKKKFIALFIPALVVIIIDQVTKQLVRTTPSLQNWDIIPGWLAFHYTQNPGMALGMDWASTPIISGIAILATIGIIFYIIRSINNANIGYLVCMGLVLGGAFGNITDRLIMGYIENYGGLLEGHVIDFIHFTLRVDGYPVFPYIFNVADISISVAIISLLLFHQRILPGERGEKKQPDPEFSLSHSVLITEELPSLQRPFTIEALPKDQEGGDADRDTISENNIGAEGDKNTKTEFSSDSEEDTITPSDPFNQTNKEL